ncbi:PREDICTED: 60S ribosomal protein L18a-like [Amphimedon queenslandica]|uniref:60S ribosomal protein L18a n=1 Tax=Amphimedon queenslandica TaxID=400682 RepID=A0A1X7VKG9_AMPQE|nr:PREDICTED: 60S ribosomal protein L18a-like [Amphimedon queenslandica]|eukprot:XP_003383990.1 PREDICTED: 60S ribosomal protein L18a-like [Amphimedon queenslandica]
MKAKGQLKEFKIMGRRLPTEKDKNPQVYRMRIFAPDSVAAKSRFWYFLKMLKKIKKANGEIVYCGKVPDRHPTVIKNVGIWLRYDSRSGTHNMYREYRDLTIAGAVTLCYRDMAARHRARASSIQIIKVEAIPANKCRRPHVKQFHNSKIRFPLPHRVRSGHFKKLFAYQRPIAFQ